MGKQYNTCKNCEENFEEGFLFCPHCGQKTKEELTFGVLFYNTINNYFSVDARFFKSFFPLLFKPGYLARRFIEGKRLLYLHPAKLFLFVSIVFFFLLTTTVVRNQVQEIDTVLKKTLEKPLISDGLKTKTQQVLDSVKIDSVLLPLKEKNISEIDRKRAKTLDSLLSGNASNETLYKAMGMDEDAGYFKRKFYEQSLKFYKQRNGGEIYEAIIDTIPLSLFILLPIFALILKLLFYKGGAYTHHLVFSLYYFSFLFTIFSFILIVNYFWDTSWIGFLLLLSTYLYLVIAIKRFYKKGWFSTFYKSALATFVYLMIVIPIAIVIISLVGFFFY